MQKLGQKGRSTPLLIALVFITLLFFGALGFGLWAFGSRQNYKNNTDQIIASQVKIAQDKTATAKDNEFAQKEKQPLKTYRGPDTYGSLIIKYPKTWSGYVSQTNDSSNPLDAHFQPNVVPDVQSKTSFALRIQIVSDAYSDVLASFSDAVSSGTARVSPFRAARVPGTLGSKVVGAIDNEKQGTMIVFPLRDKTLKIWTESSQYIGDFNKLILPNLSFSP